MFPRTVAAAAATEVNPTRNCRHQKPMVGWAVLRAVEVVAPEPNHLRNLMTVVELLLRPKMRVALAVLMEVAVAEMERIRRQHHHLMMVAELNLHQRRTLL
jgi:hypothetical protein